MVYYCAYVIVIPSSMGREMAFWHLGLFGEQYSDKRDQFLAFSLYIRSLHLHIHMYNKIQKKFQTVLC